MKPHKGFFLLFAFVFYPFPGNAASEVESLQNTEARKLISLNGKWHTIVDPYENGFCG